MARPSPFALAIPAASTTTITGPDFVNTEGYRGVVVVVDTTVIGTGSITLNIEGRDKASGKYFLLLAGAPITTNVTNVYTVFPKATVTANVSANAELPDLWRLRVVANSANPATYTVGGCTLV